MEEKLKKHIGFLRAKFNKQGLDIEKLIAILKRDQLLPPDHVAGIERQATSAGKVDKLLDEIVGAKDSTYQKLLMVVEQCMPPAVSPLITSFNNVRGNTAPGSGNFAVHWLVKAYRHKHAHAACMYTPTRNARKHVHTQLCMNIFLPPPTPHTCTSP